jgi:hypothetical protein
MSTSCEERQRDDILASPFVNAGYAQYTIDAAKWPRFSALVERVKAHSAMTPLLEAEAAAFGGSVAGP